MARELALMHHACIFARQARLKMRIYCLLLLTASCSLRGLAVHVDRASQIEQVRAHLDAHAGANGGCRAVGQELAVSTRVLLLGILHTAAECGRRSPLTLDLRLTPQIVSREFGHDRVVSHVQLCISHSRTIRLGSFPSRQPVCVCSTCLPGARSCGKCENACIQV